MLNSTVLLTHCREMYSAIKTFYSLKKIDNIAINSFRHMYYIIEILKNFSRAQEVTMEVSWLEVLLP